MTFSRIKSTQTILFTSLFIGMLITPLTSSFAAGGGGGGGGGGFSAPSGPSFDPVEKYQEGVQALQAKKYKQASKAFKKVLSVNRRNGNANYLLGLSLVGQEKYKQAIKPFTKAIKYDKKLFAAHGEIGAIQHRLGKPEKATEHRDALLALQQDCGDCRNKEKILQSLKKIDDASSGQTSFVPSTDGFHIDSNRADQAYLTAVALINQGNYQTALNSLSEASRVFGPHPDILTYQGFANRKMGNKDVALEYYQAALSIQDDHRGANEYLGEYYVEIGDLSKAKQQLVKLEKICSFGCEEAQELRRWIAEAS